MQPLFSRALLLTWALWLGGLVGVLLSVSTLFDALAPDRHAAGEIARKIFSRADLLVLVVAAGALISTAGLLLQAGTRSRKAVFALLVFAAMLALCTAAVIAPKINAMAVAGTTGTSEFKRLHGLSMGIAVLELAVLAVAGALLPNAIGEKAVQPKVAPDTIRA